MNKDVIYNVIQPHERPSCHLQDESGGRVLSELSWTEEKKSVWYHSYIEYKHQTKKKKIQFHRNRIEWWLPGAKGNGMMKVKVYKFSF